MTSECPGIDALVRLGAALDWQMNGILDHVSGCALCREELSELAAVHAALSAEQRPRPGLVDEVMRELARAERPGASIRRGLAAALTPLLAGVTALFTIALASTVTSSMQVGPEAIGAAVAAGIAAAAWNARGRVPARVAR